MKPMPKYIAALERLVCRNCGWGEIYDPEWPFHTVESACPKCKRRILVWMRFEDTAS